MRIIAGERKGFMLAAPRGLKTRPTLGRVRESLFSILGALIVDARVADLFAGAGGLGLEALSRGATHCVFVENSRPALEALRQNIEKLDYRKQALVEPRDVRRWLQGSGRLPQPGEALDLVFLDPPYHLGLAEQTLEGLAQFGGLGQGATVVAQCGSKEELAEQYGPLKRTRMERYGDTAVHFYEYVP